jgi:putative transposase
MAGMERMWSQLAPRKQAGEIAAVAVDALRPQRELVLENAVLRHQVNILRRRSKRPMLHLADRLKLLLGARWLPPGRQAIVLVVRPETVLRWHRAGFRRFWRHRSRPRTTSPLSPETIGLIRDMAARGRLWGAERIRGELLKLGIKVSSSTSCTLRLCFANTRATSTRVARTKGSDNAYRRVA